MASKITFLFDSDISADEAVGFTRTLYDDTNPVEEKETFISGTRAKTGNIGIPTPTAIPGEASAIEFAKFFANDFNSFGLYDITITSNEVVIEFLGDNIWKFGSYEDANGAVTVTIANDTEETYELVTAGAAVSQPTPCSFIRYSIETTETTDEYKINNGSWVTVNATNFDVDLQRGIPIVVYMRKGSVNIQYPTPLANKLFFASLSENSLTFQSYPSINGTVINVLFDPYGGSDASYNPPENPALVLEYSLDDSIWQSGSQFEGLSDGNYTVYVRDQFGCKISKDITVSESGLRTPIVYISKANSVTFVEPEATDDNDVMKNDKNSHSFNYLRSIQNVYSCEKILYNLTDQITIQFKSNYDNISAFIRTLESDGSTSETELTIEQQSSNLSRYGSHDAWLYDYGTGYAGLYFTTGNIYNEADLVIGTHSFNGNIPEYGIVGQYVRVMGHGIYEIVDIVYDSTIQKRVIVINYNFSGILQEVQIKSLYDLLNYEVYHVTISFASHGIGIHDLYIDFSDSNYDQRILQSENIYVETLQEDCLLIEYYNTNNRDIFYDYGIKHFIRVPFTNIKPYIKDESENNVGDSSVQLVSSILTDGNTFVFDYMTRDMLYKVMIALSCEYLFVNQEGYIKDGNFEIEEVENTNLSKLTVNLLKTNEYITNRNALTTLSSTSDQAFTEGLIIVNGSYLKI